MKTVAFDQNVPSSNDSIITNKLIKTGIKELKNCTAPVEITMFTNNMFTTDI